MHNFFVLESMGKKACQQIFLRVNVRQPAKEAGFSLVLYAHLRNCGSLQIKKIKVYEICQENCKLFATLIFVKEENFFCNCYRDQRFILRTRNVRISILLKFNNLKVSVRTYNCFKYAKGKVSTLYQLDVLYFMPRRCNIKTTLNTKLRCIS